MREFISDESMIETVREIRLPIARIRIVRYLWDSEIDLSGCDNKLRLDFCLSSRPKNARACFVDNRRTRDFESIGQVFMLPPGQAVHTKGDCTNASLVCEFEEDAIREWFEGDVDWSDGRTSGILNISTPNVTRSLIRLKEELSNPGFASKALCEVLAAQTAIDLTRYCSAMRADKPTGGLAPWKLRLIDERLAELGAAPKLTEFAKLCGLSSRQLTRAFRVSRGCSIGEYIAQNRIDHAKRLLVEGHTVKEIAAILGFSTQSNFSNAFARSTGESATQYRQRSSRFSYR